MCSLTFLSKAINERETNMSRFSVTLSAFEWEQRLVLNLVEQMVLQVYNSPKGQKFGKRATKQAIVRYLRKNSLLRDLFGRTSDNRLRGYVSYLIHRGAISGVSMTHRGASLRKLSEKDTIANQALAPIQGTATMLISEISKVSSLTARERTKAAQLSVARAAARK